MAISGDDQLKLKELLIFGLDAVPEVGDLLGVVVDLLWDPSSNVWDSIEAQVEALIQADLTTLEYTNAKQQLVGLQSILKLYQNDCADKDPIQINIQWKAAQNFFVYNIPLFQVPGYELVLLLLFVQVANMYLALLRDGVLYGASWGWNTTTQQRNLLALTNNIQLFSDYVKKTVHDGSLLIASNTPLDKHAVQPFRKVNEFIRQYTFNALDIVSIWPYFLPGTTAPNPPYHRQVCSDPFGTADDSAGGVLMPNAPNDSITAVRVWADSGSIYGLQLRYGQSTGPVQGYSNRGYNLPPYGGGFEVTPGNPIVAVSIAGGDHVTGLSFQFKDGTVSQNFGNCNGAVQLDNYNEEVNDIYLASASVFYQLCVSCIIVGYTPTALAANQETIKSLYMSSSKNIDLETLHSRIVGAKPNLNDIEHVAAIEGWSAQRDASNHQRTLAAVQLRKVS